MTEHETLSVIADDAGFLLLGDPAEVDRFLSDNSLPNKPVTPVLSKALSIGSNTAQVVGEVSANSGRWVKLTQESAEAVKKAASTGQQVSGVIRESGKIQQILKFENTAMLATPAAAPALAAAMAQMAIEQALDEISEHLEEVSEKLDALLQDQKDKALSDLYGLSRVAEDIMRIKNHTGIVSDVDWQKVATGSATTAGAQSYALRKLHHLSCQFESADSAKAIKNAGQNLNKEITDWLAVLAFSLQVEDKLALIEIDRVLSSNPNFSESHIVALKENRKRNLSSIQSSLGKVSTAIDQAHDKAVSHKFLHPRETDRAIAELNTAAQNLQKFSSSVGIALEHQSFLETPTWKTVAGEKVEGVRENVRAIGGTVEEHSARIVKQAKSFPTKLPEIQAPRLSFRKSSADNTKQSVALDE